VGDIDYGPPAEERHVSRQTSNGGGTGDMCVRDSYPVIVDHQPQISLNAIIGCLSGEKELIDSFDRSPEDAGSPAESLTHIHQHLAVLDSVQFSSDLPRVGCKEVDLSRTCCKKGKYYDDNNYYYH